MKLYVLDLEPAFDGDRGRLSISEFYVVDPGPSFRFEIASNDFTAQDGTVFVYAFPSHEDHDS